MNTEINETKFAVDLETGKLKYRGRNSSYVNSSFTGFDSSDSCDIDENLPNDRTSPTMPQQTPVELTSEKQKQEFRNKVFMFQQMATKNRKFGRGANQSNFIPSTNL